jgi:hypothetical protein
MIAEKKTLRQEYTERLRKYERELQLKLRNGNKEERTRDKK